MGTPLTRTRLCRLLGGQSVLGHQPDPSLTLDTKECGRVHLFFPWPRPSLPLASFQAGSREYFAVCTERGACSASPSQELRDVKATAVGCVGPRTQWNEQTAPGLSGLVKGEERRLPSSFSGRVWRIPWPHSEVGMGVLGQGL